MALINFFIKKKKITTAYVAKKRLQTIFNKDNTQHQFISYNLVNFKNDLIQVIKRHTHQPQNISIQFKKTNQYTIQCICEIIFSNKEI